MARRRTRYNQTMNWLAILSNPWALRAVAVTGWTAAYLLWSRPAPLVTKIERSSTWSGERLTLKKGTVTLEVLPCSTCFDDANRKRLVVSGDDIVIGRGEGVEREVVTVETVSTRTGWLMGGGPSYGLSDQTWGGSLYGGYAFKRVSVGLLLSGNSADPARFDSYLWRVGALILF